VKHNEDYGCPFTAQNCQDGNDVASSKGPTQRSMRPCWDLLGLVENKVFEQELPSVPLIDAIV
jgi:hypothetical protein